MIDMGVVLFVRSFAVSICLSVFVVLTVVVVKYSLLVVSVHLLVVWRRLHCHLLSWSHCHMKGGATGVGHTHSKLTRHHSLRPVRSVCGDIAHSRWSNCVWAEQW